MEINEIKVGHTYRSRYKGRATGTVVAIGLLYRPRSWYGNPENQPSETELGVYYRDNRNETGKMFISAFAEWAGSEVSDV